MQLFILVHTPQHFYGCDFSHSYYISNFKDCIIILSYIFDAYLFSKYCKPGHGHLQCSKLTVIQCAESTKIDHRLTTIYPQYFEWSTIESNTNYWHYSMDFQDASWITIFYSIVIHGHMDYPKYFLSLNHWPFLS